MGKERDEESGLYYYGARYYAAWVGRFVSVDPLAASYAHLNPYNYAGNKPIGDLDIDGLQSRNESPSGGSGAGNDVNWGFGTGPNQGIALKEAEVTAYEHSWFRRHIIDNIPIIGGLVNAVESISKGDWKGALLGLAEAVLDAVLLVATGGLGNIVKAGVKAGARALIRHIAKEVAENAAGTLATEALEDAGVSSEAAGIITTVIDPSAGIRKADEVVDSATGGAKRAKKTAASDADAPAMSAADATAGAAEAVAKPQGIIYKRTHPKTGEVYIGRSKSPERFEKRQDEHNRDLRKKEPSEQAIKYDFEELGRAEPGDDLALLEQEMIDAHGGVGNLANKRNEVSEARKARILRRAELKRELGETRARKVKIQHSGRSR